MSHHHRWCTQLRCCPAGTDPLDLSSAVHTTSLHTVMKIEESQKLLTFVWCCVGVCVFCDLNTLTLLGSKSSLTEKLSTTQEEDRQRSTQDTTTSSRASLEDPIL